MLASKLPVSEIVNPPMPLMEKQRLARDPKRPGYAVFKKSPRIGLFVLVLLAVLALGVFGTYLLSASSSGETGEEPSEQVAVEGQAPEEEVVKEEEASRAAPVPDDLTLYLTVPRLRIYGHTVRNDDSEAALSLGVSSYPGWAFPGKRRTPTPTSRVTVSVSPAPKAITNASTSLRCKRETRSSSLMLTAQSIATESVRSSPLGPTTPGVMEPLAGRDVVTLQTCTETPNDWWTIGPSLFGGGPESGRLVVRADRVG